MLHGEWTAFVAVIMVQLHANSACMHGTSVRITDAFISYTTLQMMNQLHTILQGCIKICLELHMS